MTMRYTFRPLLAWTEGDTANRQTGAVFRSPWGRTLALLAAELDLLDARNVVVQIDVAETDLRVDGMPRANARPKHPGVRVRFDSRHGPLVYATDRYTDWQANVRAIALSLQALRAVDRYGVTRRGEQYTGWKALPAGAGGMSDSYVNWATGTAPSGMTPTDAAALLERVTVGSDGPEAGVAASRILMEPELAAEAYKHSRRTAHPDRYDGDRTLWDQVEQAARALGLT